VEGVPGVYNMQNSSITSAQLSYSDKEPWTTWRSSNARERHIKILLADGCSLDGANTQADFNFEAHVRKLGEGGTSPEDEIDMFEHDMDEMELWSQWESSNTRIRHITSLLTTKMSPKEAIGQADLDFKIHSSGLEIRGSTPEAKMESFERYSNDQILKRIWGSSKARQRHINSLLANGFSPEGANKQADVDFSDFSRELAKRELPPEAKLEVFEEYFESIFDYSFWERGKVEIGPQFLQREREAEVPDPLEAIGRRDPDRLWRHL
jgi:hypothetical protein